MIATTSTTRIPTQGTPALVRNATVGRLERDGTCWCGGTEWQGRAAMRISVSSWATTEADVERSLDAILRVAAEDDRASPASRHPASA